MQITKVSVEITRNDSVFGGSKEGKLEMAW